MKRLATLLLSVGFLLGLSATAFVAPAGAAPHNQLTFLGTANSSSCKHTNGGTGSHSCSSTSPGQTGIPTTSAGTPSTTPTGAPHTTSTPAVGTLTGLAFTGADVAMTLAVATVLVGIGLVTVQLSRRRTA